VLQQLHEMLQAEALRGAAVTVTIVGMAGVGKTELGLQYGKAFLEDYPGGVGWFEAGNFQQGLIQWLQARFSPDRDLRRFPDLQQQVAEGWRQWRQFCESRLALVIVDDVTDYAQQVAPYLPQELGEGCPFRFLLTSRLVLQSRSEQFKHLELAQLSLEGAIALLSGRIGAERVEAEHSEAERLCVSLGMLPLALTLVADWLSLEPERGVSSALAELVSQGLEARSLQPDPWVIEAAAQQGVKAAFALSWEQLGQLQESGQPLARLLSLFGTGDVPWELVEAVIQQYQPIVPAPSPAASPKWGWFGLRRGDAAKVQPKATKPVQGMRIREPIEGRAALLRTSLLQRVGEAQYRVHPLLREFFEEQWRGFDQLGWRRAFGEVLSDRAAKVPKEVGWEKAAKFDLFRPHWEAALEMLQKLETHSDPTEAKVYKNQARTIMAGLFRLEQPVLFEVTFERVYKTKKRAKAAAAQGQEGLARQLFQEVLEGCRQAAEQAREAFAAESLQRAGYLYRISELLRELGNYREGIPLAEEAVSIAEAKAEPLTLARYLNNLAFLYDSQGRYGEAEPLLARSLSIRERQLGADHPDVAFSLNNLAGLYNSQGRYGEAEPLFARSLSIYERQLGADHPHMATSLNNLAELYKSQGRYGEAEPLLARSLSILERQLGADHPHVATSLNNLARLYNSQGRYGEAEPLLARSLSINERQLGADHPHVAFSLNSLAGLYQSQGRYSEAEPLYVRSLSIRERQLGADHPNVASSLNNLALLYQSQGRYGEAEPLYARSLSILERQLGADHPDVAPSLNGLALIYQSQGRYGEAEPLYVRSLSILERQLGADHPDVATSLNGLAKLYQSQGRYGEAEPLYVRSLSIRERQLGADHPDVATSLNNLAALYYSQGRYGEAEPLYARSLTIRQKVFGSDHFYTLSVKFNLKFLQMMNASQCNSETFSSALKDLAQETNLSDLNQETKLSLLEALEADPERLSQIKEALQSKTEKKDGDLERLSASAEGLESDP
jgi:tetratricopeptide (TPR) repeat protein